MQCADKIKNAGESDIDCGGPIAPRCADDKACTKASDCWGERCDMGRCQPGPAKRLAFAPPVYYRIGAVDKVERYVLVTRVADLNHDQIPDVVVAGDAKVSILLGLGGGRFGPPRIFTVGGGDEAVLNILADLAVGDFDQDGWNDLVVTEDLGIFADAGKAHFLYNDAGKWSRWEHFSTGKLGHPEPRVAVGDFDFDGRQDVAVPISGNFDTKKAGAMTMFWNEGLGKMRPQDIDLAGAGAIGVATIDLGGDCLPDLLASGDYFKRQWSWITNQGARKFRAESRGAERGYTKSPADLWDLDGDGAVELVVDEGTKGAVIYKQVSGDFVEIQRVKPGPEAISLLRDMNGDGRPDLVGPRNGYDTFFVAPNIGRGELGPAVEVDCGSCGFSVGFAIADLDGDGQLDVLTGGNDKTSFGVFVTLNRSR